MDPTIGSLCVALLVTAPRGAVTGEPAAQAAMWEVLGHFDEFPGAHPYAIADSLETRGAELHAAGFNTDQTAEQVVEFYRKEFQREGLFAVPSPPSMQFQGLSAFDPKSGLEKTVVVTPGHGGKTQVVLSIADGDALTEAASADQSPEKAVDQSDGLPVFPDASPLRSDSRDGAHHATTITFRTQQATAPAAAQALAAALAGQGWTEGSGSESSDLRHTFRRDNERLELLVTPAADVANATDVTYVHMW